ncbi:MAG: family 78 glycoside hydrolase catalytic domain [Armatimonas sp.]
MKPGVWLADFGINFAGRIGFDAVPGANVTVRYGELLQQNGTLNPMTSVCGQIKGGNKPSPGSAGQ